MNSTTDSLSNHNEPIFSIGTETSEYNSQNGGFLDKLFSKGADKDKKYANMTKLIMDALSQNNIVIADYLLGIPFIPDASIVDENGNNLLHALITAEKTKNITSAMLQLISNKDFLNKANNNGDTPLHIAVKGGNMNQYVEMMIVCGADRKVNKEGYGIMTDYDTYTEQNDKNISKDIQPFREQYERQLDRMSDIISVDHPEQDKMGIFAKQYEPKNTRSNFSDIGQIIKAFATSKTDTDTVIGNTGIETEYPTIEPTGKLESKDYDVAMDSDKFVKYIAERLVGGTTKKLKGGVTKTISGTRSMISDNSEKAKNNMKKIARTTEVATNNFQEQAKKKILDILNSKNLSLPSIDNTVLAEAIRDIIYHDKIENKKMLSDLDRAAELLEAIDDNSVLATLKQKTRIDLLLANTKNKDTKKFGRMSTTLESSDSFDDNTDSDNSNDTSPSDDITDSDNSKDTTDDSPDDLYDDDMSDF